MRTKPHAGSIPANAPSRTLRHPLFLCSLAGLMSLGLVLTAAEVKPVTTATIMEDMTGLAALAEFPSPAYTCKQFSSYDQKSRKPGNDDWFANGDCGQYLRTEENAGRKEFVMMDATGPGTVVRIWSANPAGNLRIYLDGAQKPAIEAPMSELLGGKFAGLPKPISGEYSKGWNFYFPIPYAKSCKITSDKGNFYYHVNYRTYAAGTPVETFNLDQIKTLGDRISKLATQLAAPRGEDADMGGTLNDYELELEPGKPVQVDYAGPKAFTSCTVKLSAQNPEAALRGVIVKMTFDGENCVEAPLGDLFGSAPGINPYSALPLGVTKDGEMYCHWLMPFKESAVVQLINTTTQNVRLTGALGVKDYQWTERSMHFHAKWRVQFDVPTRPMIDWNYMTAQGKGVFAGVAFFIDNPVKDWWGEGDEKIYVDDETFPSHFGTGTEDYYGYAWCWPGLFTHAYHNQPRCDGPGNYGRTSVNRFHIVDRIPFTKNFKFDMELWHWHKSCNVNMAVTAYWYALAGATDAFKAIKNEDLVVRPMTAYTPPRVKGALEGEDLKILRVKGTAEPQDWDLSNGKQLWWHAGMKPGDTLVLAVPVTKAGKYKMFARFLKAKDYGIHQLAINGSNIGDPIDFYAPQVTPTSERLLGDFDLKEGNNELSVTVVGANEKAVKAYMFGLDYILLKPAE